MTHNSRGVFMRKFLAAAGIAVACVLAGVGVAAHAGSSSDSASTLDLPSPSWLTPQLEAQIVAAGEIVDFFPYPENVRFCRRYAEPTFSAASHDA
jgi:hypothetical protein